MTPFIVGIGGTTRANSSSERLVRAVLRETESLGATVQMFGGAELARLPHFAPELTCRTDEQRRLVEAVRRADGLVLGSPGYHGGVSGLVKNAIDLLEDCRDDPRPYLDGRPVGLLVVAGGPQAGGVTLQALRGIVHALRGWPTPQGIAVTSSGAFDAQGAIIDAQLRRAVADQARQLMHLATVEARSWSSASNAESASPSGAVQAALT